MHFKAAFKPLTTPISPLSKHSAKESLPRPIFAQRQDVILLSSSNDFSSNFKQS